MCTFSFFFPDLLLIVVPYASEPALSKVYDPLSKRIKIDLDERAPAHAQGLGALVKHFDLILWDGYEDFPHPSLRRINCLSITHEN